MNNEPEAKARDMRENLLKSTDLRVQYSSVYRVMFAYSKVYSKVVGGCLLYKFRHLTQSKWVYYKIYVYLFLEEGNLRILCFLEKINVITVF